MRSRTLSQLAVGTRNNFDFLRLFLACLVVYSHSFFLLGTKNEDVVVLATHGQEFGGGLAIKFFFLISGFLITQSWLYSSSIVDYLKKRVLRIYPAFIVAALFSMFVAGPLGTVDLPAYSQAVDLRHFLMGLFSLAQLMQMPAFLNSAVPEQLNGSLWTIRIEFECYLLVIALGILGVFRQRTRVLALFVVVYAVYFLYGLLPAPLARFFAHVEFGTFFLAGMTVYLYRDRLPLSRRWLAGSALLLVATAVGNGFDKALPVLGSYCLFYFAFSPAIKLHDTAKRGDLSYGVYLYAWPVQQLVIHYLGREMSPYLLFVFALAITAGFAALSWHFVEAPALRLKRVSLASLPPIRAARGMQHLLTQGLWR
jgi:peptidoglycan/LPS O-acetylase OafA/YrhL